MTKAAEQREQCYGRALMRRRGGGQARRPTKVIQVTRLPLQTSQADGFRAEEALPGNARFVEGGLVSAARRSAACSSGEICTQSRLMPADEWRAVIPAESTPGIAE